MENWKGPLRTKGAQFAEKTKKSHGWYTKKELFRDVSFVLSKFPNGAEANVKKLVNNKKITIKTYAGGVVKYTNTSRINIFLTCFNEICII